MRKGKRPKNSVEKRKVQRKIFITEQRRHFSTAIVLSLPPPLRRPLRLLLRPFSELLKAVAYTFTPIAVPFLSAAHVITGLFNAPSRIFAFFASYKLPSKGTSCSTCRCCITTATPKRCPQCGKRFCSARCQIHASHSEGCSRRSFGFFAHSKHFTPSGKQSITFLLPPTERSPDPPNLSNLAGALHLSENSLRQILALKDAERCSISGLKESALWDHHNRLATISSGEVTALHVVHWETVRLLATVELFQRHPPYRTNTRVDHLQVFRALFPRTGAFLTLLFGLWQCIGRTLSLLRLALHSRGIIWNALFILSVLTFSFPSSPLAALSDYSIPVLIWASIPPNFTSCLRLNGRTFSLSLPLLVLLLLWFSSPAEATPLDGEFKKLVNTLSRRRRLGAAASALAALVSVTAQHSTVFGKVRGALEALFRAGRTKEASSTLQQLIGPAFPRVAPIRSSSSSAATRTTTPKPLTPPSPLPKPKPPTPPPPTLTTQKQPPPINISYAKAAARGASSVAGLPRPAAPCSSASLAP